MLLIREPKLTTLFLACPRTASSASEAALKATLGPLAQEIYPTHGLSLEPGSPVPDRVVTTVRAPVPFYLSWINYVRNSPAHWQLGEALSGGDWSLGGLLSGLLDPWSRGRPVVSPLFLEGDDEARLQGLLEERRCSLWEAALRLYGAGATDLVDQGRLAAGLSQVFEAAVEVPKLNVTAQIWPRTRSFLEEIPPEVLEEIEGVDGFFSGQLGYRSVLDDRASRAVLQPPADLQEPSC